jgi:HAD superfamily hydrolase (TIGR01509 family)
MTDDQLGIIFDWDGVIIDSGKQHEESWEQLAREEGRTLPDGHFKLGFGRKNEAIIRELLQWTADPSELARLSARKEVLYREIVVAKGIVALPGVKIFLERLRAAAVPCCIGSSTSRENIETVISLVGLTGLFGDMVTAADVVQGKPHPEVFLKAGARTGCAPDRCIVFEDALAGIAAARAGGMKVVGVATTNPAAVLAPHVDRVVHRLDELTVEALRELVGPPNSRLVG